jgi:hypothetical protein
MSAGANRTDMRIWERPLGQLLAADDFPPYVFRYTVTPNYPSGGLALFEAFLLTLHAEPGAADRLFEAAGRNHDFRGDTAENRAFIVDQLGNAAVTAPIVAARYGEIRERLLRAFVAKSFTIHIEVVQGQIDTARYSTPPSSQTIPNHT